MKYNIVIGGGITGLYSAHILQKRFPEIPCLIIESAPVVGGLLKSKTYGEHGTFDYGVHTFYETGDAEIDGYFTSLPIDWKFLTGYERDIGGAAWGNEINYKAPFLDVSKSKNADIYRKEIGEIVASGGAQKTNESAQAHFKAHFGDGITRDYMDKAIAARQHQSAEDTHWLAAMVQGLRRVSLDDEAIVLKNYKTPEYSARIGFPDQYTYPKDIIPAKRGYYPKRVGLGRVIDAIAADLLARGVTILTGAKLKNSSVSGPDISAVTIAHSDGTEHRYDVNRLVCTAPLPAFLFTLDNRPPPQPFLPAHQTVIVNLISKTPPKDGGLYYYFWHGHERIHRVSFPYNYSNEDPRQRGYAICTECVYPRGDDVSSAPETVIKGLVESGVIDGPDSVIFRDHFVTVGGYPNLSLGNVEGLSFYRNFMQERGFSNFDSVGILAREDLFFQFDLIKHAHETLV